MAGYTKYKYKKDQSEAIQRLNQQLQSMIGILPKNYSFEDIKNLFKRFYPHDYFILENKFQSYQEKEKSLIARGKKSRYDFTPPEELIKKTTTYKKLSSPEYQSTYSSNFDSSSYDVKLKALKKNRDPKIAKINEKIEKAKLKTQQIEPIFLDSLMGLYDRKTTSQKDKVYILKELQKYYCTKVIKFFHKKNDTEYNFQLREMAFFYLQSIGYQPVLRKQKYMRIPSENKKRREFLKKTYAKERFNIEALPHELEYRITNSREQKIKTFDYFISHSSSNAQAVQNLILHLNKKGKNIYCDWINDNDYLKRHLVGKATLNVIIERMRQSNKMIFVKSEESLDSRWCKYELNDFKANNKDILFIDIKNIFSNQFNLSTYHDDWYVDNNYKSMELF